MRGRYRTDTPYLPRPVAFRFRRRRGASTADPAMHDSVPPPIGRLNPAARRVLGAARRPGLGVAVWVLGMVLAPPLLANNPSLPGCVRLTWAALGGSPRGVLAAAAAAGRLRNQFPRKDEA